MAQAEERIEKWLEEERFLKATREAAERAARRLPGPEKHDEVAWADADRRVLGNLARAGD